MSIDEDMIKLALKYHREGDITTAASIYNQILQIDPDNINALYLMGMLTYQNNEYDKALIYLNEAVKRKPLPLLYQMLGNIFVSKNDFINALICYENAIQLDPNFYDVYNNYGYVFYNSGKYDEAIYYYKKAAEFEPDNFKIYFNIALSYDAKSDYKNAAENYRKVIEINPCYTDAYNNLGSLHYNYLREYDKAREYFEKAIELSIDDLSANKMFQYNLSRVYLIVGNFEKGWINFESRIDLFEHHKLKFSENECPKLHPSDSINGKTVYVYTAGGYGDTVQFARYLPVMQSMGAKIICRIKPKLKNLFEQSDLKADEYITYDPVNAEIPEKGIKFDYQTSFMSLPYVFNANIENIPHKSGFLKTNNEKTALYKEKYFNNNNLKVGIVWQASETQTTRSIPHIKHLYKLAKIPNIKLYSLQKEYSVEQFEKLPPDIEITDLGKILNDFSDTAAVINNLDLLLSIDSVLLHIAGGLNIPAWGMLSYAADWRWLVNTEESFWYNSVKLFRQQSPGNWDELIDRIYNRLLSLTKD